MSQRRVWVECEKEQAQLRIRVFDADVVPDDVWIRRVPIDEAAQRMRAAYLRFAGQDDLWEYLLRAALGEDTQ